MKTDETLAAKVAESLEAVRASLEQLHAGMASFDKGVRQQGARHADVAGVDRPLLITRSAGRLLGWSFKETAGAPATIVLRDAHNAAGDVVAYVHLDAGAAETIWLGPVGVSLLYGLFVDVADGAAQGTVYLGTDQA